MTAVCGDSHTSTHGAFGCLAFGMGSTEVAHVLATQCLLQRKPKTFGVNVRGKLGDGVTAKDLILAIITRIGVAGGTGHVLEYRGTTIRKLSMEERMTVCNMSIEAGARAGMIAPMRPRSPTSRTDPRAPQGDEWDAAVERWRAQVGDADAQFDTSVDIDADEISPMVTYGTNPGMSVPINEAIPTAAGDAAFDKALSYMGFHVGELMLGKPVNMVFIGSCTNGRLEDLHAAAKVLAGRRVAPGVQLIIVPGSQQIKREAEAGRHRRDLSCGRRLLARVWLLDVPRYER